MSFNCSFFFLSRASEMLSWLAEALSALMAASRSLCSSISKARRTCSASSFALLKALSRALKRCEASTIFGGFSAPGSPLELSFVMNTGRWVTGGPRRFLAESLDGKARDLFQQGDREARGFRSPCGAGVSCKRPAGAGRGVPIPRRLKPADGEGFERALEFPLKHYSRDTFSWQPIGENALGRSGLSFLIGPDGRASAFRDEYLDTDGAGALTRSS